MSTESNTINYLSDYSVPVLLVAAGGAVLLAIGIYYTYEFFFNKPPITQPKPGGFTDIFTGTTSPLEQIDEMHRFAYTIFDVTAEGAAMIPDLNGLINLFARCDHLLKNLAIYNSCSYTKSTTLIEIMYSELQKLDQVFLRDNISPESQ